MRVVVSNDLSCLPLVGHVDVAVLDLAMLADVVPVDPQRVPLSTVDFNRRQEVETDPPLNPQGQFTFDLLDCLFGHSDCDRLGRRKERHG